MKGALQVHMRLKTLLVTLLAYTLTAPTLAQQPTVEQLMKELENLFHRLEELEKWKKDEFPKVKEDTAKLSKAAKAWEKKAKELLISGDIRFRYDHEENVRAGATDRGRERLRLRIKGMKQIDQYINFGMMLATAPDPISDNQTLESLAQDPEIRLNQAFFGYSPNNQRTRVVGGLIPNPFMSTEVIWDSDYNFPGLALSHVLKAESEKSPGEVKFVLGQFVVDEEANNADARLTALQLQGKNSKLGIAGAISYYKYSDTLDPKDVPGGARGNRANAAGDTYVSGFAPLDFLLQWDLPQPEGKLPIQLTLDYVKNNDADDANKGWAIQAAFNKKPAKKNDWQLLAQYRKVEADATVAAFADSDWDQLNGAGKGTNVKGFEIEYVRMLSDKVQGALSWFHVKPEDGSNEASNRFFVDLSTKF